MPPTRKYNTRGGVFPEFKIKTTVRTMHLGAIELWEDDRGVPEHPVARIGRAPTRHVCVACPYCDGELRVSHRSYQKCKNDAVRRHLKVCTVWRWLPTAPKSRPTLGMGKPTTGYVQHTLQFASPPTAHTAASPENAHDHAHKEEDTRQRAPSAHTDPSVL